MWRWALAVLFIILLPCGNAKAALEGLEDGKTYTQEELEAIAKQQMGEGYQEYLAGKASIPELQNQIETEQQNYKEQQNKLNEKVRAGLITDKEYNQQSKELKKTTEDRIKKLEKEVDKQEDAVKDFEKEFEKTQKDINKQLEKQQKEAEKAAEAQRKAEEKAAKAQQKLEDKATKQNEKLQAAVAECQAMNASPEKRWECEEKARKKYGLSDKQQQALDEKEAREQAQSQSSTSSQQPTQVASAVSDSAVGVASSEVSPSAVSDWVVDPAASRTGTSTESTSSSSANDDDDWGFAKIKRQEREKAEKEAQEKQQEKENALAQQKEFVNSLPTEEAETPDAQLEQMLANREAEQQKQEFLNSLPVEEEEIPDAQTEQMVVAKNTEQDALKKRVDEGREARSQAINNMSEEQKKQISEVKSIVNDIYGRSR